MPNAEIYTDSCLNGTKHLLVFCSMVYLGTTMICDPFALLSRTQADLIKDNLVKAGFSSCVCSDSMGDKCTAWRVLILLVTNGMSRRNAHTLVDPQCPHEMAAMESQVANLQSRDISLTTDALLNQWAASYSCSPDVAVLVYKEQDVVTKKNTVIFVTKVRRLFLEAHPEILAQNLTMPVLIIPDNESWFNALVKHISAVTSATGHLNSSLNGNAVSQRESKIFSMPLWANVLLICCVVLVPITVILERLLASSRNMRLRQNRGIETKGFLSNWRAGFAAGMLARNFNITKERRRSEVRMLMSNTPRQSFQCTANL
ncbi:Reverse transcriptase [Trichuris trichiura]|uniref:Reverse transcriptase n=1 Tax=Trichuris trichiura TaxID=36087 RepID=A0A077Z6E6_TRITR|nr:Reverse transcriptase [Trichuris trichiura]